jgi:hypothetical protein
LPVAKPKPAVQSGGIRAVAIATPGITVGTSLRELATIPARPPKIATPTSRSVGVVRAVNSLVICPKV